MPKILAAVCAALFFVSATAGDASPPEPSQATSDNTQPAATPPQVDASVSAQGAAEGATVRAAAETPATQAGTFDGSRYRKARCLGGREPVDARGSDAPVR